MNESIDIILTTAKVASRNNSCAHLATHSISMEYNLSMVGYYSYQLEMLYAMNRVTSYGANLALSYAAAEQVQRLKQERIKHIVLGTLDGLGMILYAIHSIQENRR